MRMETCRTCGGKGYILDFSAVIGQTLRNNCYKCDGTGEGPENTTSPASKDRETLNREVADQQARDNLKSQIRHNLI